MKKIILKSLVSLILATYVTPYSGFSQKLVKESAKAYCTTDQLHYSLYKNSMDYRGKFDKMNADWQKWAVNIESETPVHQQNVQNSTEAITDETLPVIFHMMVGGTTLADPAANTTDGNLSKTQIQNALLVLNKIYAGQATGSKPASLNTHLQFCLAEVDGKGNAITSYTYTNPLSGPLDNNSPAQISALSNAVQNTGKFPTTKYINIYVVDDIAGNTAGFAFMPPAHGSAGDGIYVEAQYLLPPTVNDLSYNMTVLSHEMGHYMGLFHTFGICKTLTQTCSCYNNNCLFDGDMICDTPPDFSQDYMACGTATNTCHTDHTPAITDGTHPATDINDLITNYMDYGNWSCENTFTQGQIKRMHFMIDKFVGPRNSLLNSTACNPICIKTCTISVTSPTATVNGVSFPNTLILSGTSVSYNFIGNLCGSYNTRNWSAMNLTTGVVFQTATTAGFNVTFTGTGNYRILFKASVSGSSPLCYQTDTLDIQVLPPAACPGNLDMGSNWLTNWQRIKYEGGWSKNLDGSYAFPTTSLSILSPTVANGTTNNDPFSMVTSLATDPNFSSVGLPAGVSITKVMRVGKVITPANALPLGDAAYVTYTFSPTQANSRLRVYYLGMKEQDISTSIEANTFERNIQMPTTFGFVCNYDFASADGSGIAHRGVLYTGSTGLRYGKNDMIAGQVHSPAFTTTVVGTNSFDKMTQWSFHDLDFTDFACGTVSPTITITFFARSDNSSTLGYKHAYAYFAAKCLPGNYSNIDLALNNIDIGCATNVGQSCTSFELPKPDNLAAYDNWGYYNVYYNMLNVKVDESNDNITYTPAATVLQNTYDYPYVVPALTLCKAPDNHPYKYFKITYSNLCQTKTDTISVYQGFVHNLSCSETSTVPIHGGHFINPPVGSATYSPDKYVQYCSSATLSLTPPCWVNPGDPAPEYKWQVNGGDIFGATSASLVVSDENLCYSYKRLAKYNDPYCGTPVWVPGDEFVVSSLKANSFNVDIIGPDECTNSPATIGINNFYESYPVTFCDPELNARAQATPTVNSVSMSFFSQQSCIPSSSLAASAGPSVLTFTCQNFFFAGAGAYYNGPINTSFTFNNNGIYNQDGTAYMLVKVTRYGCVSTFTVPVTIKIKPSAIAGTITSVANGCLNPTVLNGDNANTTVGSGNRYQWEYSYTSNFASPVAISGAVTYSCTVPVASTFTVYPVYFRRKAIGTQDCPKVAYSNTITLNASPFALTASANKTVTCQGTSVTLAASGAATYTWQPINLAGSSVTVSPSVSTTYTVNGTTVNGCILSKTIAITVQPSGTISVTASSGSVCAGGSVTLTAGGSLTYTWTGGGLTTTVNPYVVSPAVSTTYTVSNACSNVKMVTVAVIPLPIITIATPIQTICAGSSVTLSATEATTYTWTGGSITSTLNPVVVSPTATTIYTFTGKNMEGCPASKTATVVVLPVTAIGLAALTQTICAGNTATLAANGSATYTWTGGSTPSSTVNPRVVSPAITTVYTVSGTNSNGCKANATTTITVLPVPSLTVSPLTQSVCSTNQFTLTAAGASSYTWSGAGATTAGNPLITSASVTTVYTVTGSGNGCTSSKTATVTILSPPSLTVSPVATTVCSGNATTLTGSGAISYTWTGGAVNTTVNPVVVSPSVTTIYTLIGKTGTGCAATKTVAVTVNAAPILTVAPTGTVCLGNTASIGITAYPGINYSVSPLPTQAITPIDGHLIFQVLPTGNTTYTVTAINPSSGCVTTATTQIYTVITPTVTLTANPNPLCAGSSVTLTAGGASYYSWTGLNVPQTTSVVVVSPADTTLYKVTASNMPFVVNGATVTPLCRAAANVVVNVVPAPTLTITTANPATCSAGTVTLTAAGASTYTWVTPAGSFTQNPFTVNPTVATSYTLTGANANGCRAIKTGTVNAGPALALNVSTLTSTICVGSTATLTASGASSYTWTNGVTSSSSNPYIVSPTITTTYTVTGTNGTCTATKIVSVTVLPHIDKPVSINITRASACSGSDVELSAGGASTYTWTSSPAAAITQSITGSVIHSTVTATSVFTVVGTESNGCKEQATITVSVSPSPTVTLTFSPAVVCAGNSVTLTATGAADYNWVSNPVSAITQNSFGSVVVTNAMTGTTVFTVTGEGPGKCSAAAILTLTVDPACSAAENCSMVQCTADYIPFFRYLSPASITSTSVTVRNTSLYSHNFIVPFGIFSPPCQPAVTHTVSYSWMLKKTVGTNAPQTICSNVISRDFSWANLSDGMYELTMSMIIKQTVNGVTYSCTINRTSEFGIGQGYYTTAPLFRMSSGEAESGNTSSQPLWKVYPNPATTEVFVDWQNTGEPVKEIGFYDMTGKQIQLFTIQDPGQRLITIHTREVANGIYYVKIRTEKQVYLQKLTIYR